MKHQTLTTLKITTGAVLLSAGLIGIFHYFDEGSSAEKVNEEAALIADAMLDKWEDQAILPGEPIDDGQPKIFIENTPIAVIEIPKLGVKRVIAEGINSNVLDDPATGVGKYLNTADFGENGNISLAAHRRANGGAFLKLDQLVSGDQIIIQPAGAQSQIVYTVTDILIVTPKDTWVLQSTLGNAELTLITCHPLGSFNQRLVIKADI